MFPKLERKAFDLGQRMAETGFGVDDNPFQGVQPRLSARWDQGYSKVCAIRALAESFAAAREPSPAVQQPAVEPQRATLRVVNG